MHWPRDWPGAVNAPQASGGWAEYPPFGRESKGKAKAPRLWYSLRYTMPGWLNSQPMAIARGASSSTRCFRVSRLLLGRGLAGSRPRFVLPYGEPDIIVTDPRSWETLPDGSKSCSAMRGCPTSLDNFGLGDSQVGTGCVEPRPGIARTRGGAGPSIWRPDDRGPASGAGVFPKGRLDCRGPSHR